MLFMLYSCENRDLSGANKAHTYHSFNTNNLTINFSLPSYYTKIDNEDFCKVIGNYSDEIIRNTKTLFVSNENTKNLFTISCFYDSLIDLNLNRDIDSYVIFFLKEYYHALYPGVTLTERKIDKNGNIFYYLMISCRYPYDHKMTFFDFMKTDSVYSKFEFYTIVDDQHISIVLESIENIKDFSYEEKRKILESITIE